MAEDKKISQLGQLTTIGGDELFVVASEDENYSVKSSTIKSYAQQGMVKEVAGKGLSSNDYTDEDKAKLASLSSSSDNTAALAGKLDKSVWDDEHKQFGLVGYWEASGKAITHNADNYRRTGLIPINHGYDIATHCWGNKNVMGLILFDANKLVVGIFPCNTESSNAECTVNVTAANIPSSARYFATSTNIARIAESSYSNGPTLESREGATSEAIQASKLNLFIDLWTKGYDCTYDATKTKPFKCNEVELTYEEAIAVYNAPRITYNQLVGFIGLNSNPKTVILGSSITRFDSPDMNYAFNTSSFVCLRFSPNNSSAYVKSMRYAFSRCMNLRKILGGLRVSPIAAEDKAHMAFELCNALEDVNLRELKVSISFQDSPLLSLASLQYLVTNAANTSAITVTVHPTTYAKLTDTSNTQWHAVLTSAASKNISFATT